ncbi:MAG: 23S rRNA (pseudouridine(1915)-N(3))-methyltransferase RlmH [Armatimonadota bacterium]
MDQRSPPVLPLPWGGAARFDGEGAGVRPRITLVVVGKLRETWWEDACAEYLKRLGGLASSVVVHEVADEPTPQSASDADEARTRMREGERILARVPERDVVVALDVRGSRMDSVAFSRWMERRCAEGSGTGFTFVIGGSLGLSDAVLARADQRISYGPMTFPHALARVMLLEQLYRAFRIQRGEPYHK